jgi:hypothetical protein
VNSLTLSGAFRPYQQVDVHAKEAGFIRKIYVDVSESGFRLGPDALQLGLSSMVELSQAELQKTQAEIGNAEAGYEYRLALSALRYQTAGL